MILTGAIQLVCGVLRLGKFIRLVPKPVMLGFVNGLALVIGIAQFEQFRVGHAWLQGAELYTMCGLVAATMAFLKFWPKVTMAIPAPLAGIVFMTTLVKTSGLPTRTVGDLSSISGSLPMLHVPQVPLSLETLGVLLPYAISVAAVGLIETLLTQQLVDEATGRRTETHTECIGQGVASVASGAFGTMGGCAMIAQSVLNVSAGGRTRISGFSCAGAIAAFVVVGGPLIEAIPLAALVGVMWTLTLDIFDFTSFRRLGQMPKVDSSTMVLVTLVTYLTNLAVAVFAGVALAALGFAWKSAARGVQVKRRVEFQYDEAEASGHNVAIYEMAGPLFFGSTQAFAERFREFTEGEDEQEVVLDFMDARVWDSSALEAVADVAMKFETSGKQVALRHLSPDCRKLLGKAGSLVTLTVLEDDPDYGVAMDYPADVVDRDIEGLGKKFPTVGGAEA